MYLLFKLNPNKNSVIYANTPCYKNYASKAKKVGCIYNCIIKKSDIC